MSTNLEKSVQIASPLEETDILLELGSMGAGHASAALSNVLSEPIKIEVPRLHKTQPHLIPKLYGKHDTAVIAVFMQLRSTENCDIMLIFEVEEAKKIAALMTNTSENTDIDEEMKKSAIEELGSIMVCSFLNAMADFTLTELVPTPPQLIIDSFDAVIDGLLLKQALCSNIAVVFDTRFRRCNSSAEGYFIMFPSEELRTLLINKGKEWLK